MKIMVVVQPRCAIWCPELSPIVIGVLYIYRTWFRAPKCATMRDKALFPGTEQYLLFGMKIMIVVQPRCANWCPEASPIVLGALNIQDSGPGTKVRNDARQGLVSWHPLVNIIWNENNACCTPSLRNLVHGGESYSIRSSLYIGLGSGYQSAQRCATRPFILASNSMLLF